MQYKYTIIFITIFIPNHPNHNYMKKGFTHIPPTHTCLLPLHPETSLNELVNGC